jgi:L-alanine-DL-glutamate epimerase-like enolase superfamily enzyme
VNQGSPAIERVSVRVFRIPTDEPEADGTISWDSTTLVLVEATAGGTVGLGYSYASSAAATLIAERLGGLVEGRSLFAIPAAWSVMVSSVRNIGWPGIAACAISAVDTALWDLKAKVLELPLCDLLGAERDNVPIYGSGGFTFYSMRRIAEQLGNWVEQSGCRAVKMKVGTRPDQDLERVQAARSAIGDAELYVDANGALECKVALQFAERYAEMGITWFEEPVSSDDLAGLRLLRDRAPAGMAIVAGEYGYEPFYFRRMLEAGAVDILQADATRCGGFTGFLRAAAISDGHMTPLSTHTAPALHLHVACAAPRLKNVEWFHDHARIEAMLFDGAPVPHNGVIRPDRSRFGLGLDLKESDASRFAAS